jgi:Ca-activated chloride channel family protein
VSAALAALLAAGQLAAAAPGALRLGAGDAAQPPVPRFRSAVQVVTVAAVVRDRKGRFVADLDRDDFEVLDRGRRRPIVEFRAGGQGSVSVALLVDESGSMRLGSRMEAARQAAGHLMNVLDPARGDEVAVFTFDAELRELAGFGGDFDAARRSLERLQPFGSTSLFDAIAHTAERIGERASRRRAVVVVTDGVDTSSRMAPGEVSAAASAIDVPVYVVAVGGLLEREVDAAEGYRRDDRQRGELTDLARWTGGELFVATGPAEAQVAAQQIVSELRYQYLLAIEASPDPGWHPLEVRTRNPELRVRARSGYIAGPAERSAVGAGR